MAAKKKFVKTDSPMIDWADFQADLPNYDACYRIVGEWLRSEWNGDNGTKKAKAEVVFWFTNEGIKASAVAAIEAVDDWRFHHLGKLYYMMNNGAVLKDETLVWLEGNMKPLLEMGYEGVKQQKKVAEAKAKAIGSAVDPKFVETMAGQALASNLEDLILTGEFGNEMNSAFDVLKSHAPKPSVLRAGIARLQEYVDELNSFTVAEIDEGFPSEDAHKEAIISYGELLRVATTFTANAKTRRKATRKRKPKYGKESQALKDVSNVNVMAEFPALNLVGVPLEKMVGAKGVMVYNTKERKLGIFYAKDDTGLQIKGTTIKNFDEEKSGQKKLRKPEAQIETVRSVTMKRAQIIIRDNINAKMSKITGRLNNFVVILAAWK